MIKILIAVIVLVLVGGSVALYVTKSSQTEMKNNEQNTQTQQKPITEGSFTPDVTKNFRGSGTFRNLLGLGKNVMCTIRYTPANFDGTFNGTVYVSGDKLRADMTTTGTETGELKTSIISDTVTNYIWGTSEQGSMAIKSTVIVDTGNKTVTNPNQFNLDENVDYDCRNWTVDSSKFVPPQDIQFMDMSAMMNTVPKVGTDLKNVDVKALQCGACAQITESGPKTECLQTFACN